MEMLIAPSVLIALVLFVAWPLLKEGMPEELVGEPTDFEVAVDEKEAALSNLKDVEMDYRMGKLSDEDYQDLKADLEVRAVEALEKVDSLGGRKGSPRKKRS